MYNAYFVHARALCVIDVFVKRKLGVVSVHSAEVNFRRERRGGADGGFCTALLFFIGALVEHKIFELGFHYRRADSDSDISCGIRLGNDFSVLSDADDYNLVPRNGRSGQNISFRRPFDNGIERVLVFAQLFAYLRARPVHFLAEIGLFLCFCNLVHLLEYECARSLCTFDCAHGGCACLFEFFFRLTTESVCLLSCFKPLFFRLGEELFGFRFCLFRFYSCFFKLLDYVFKTLVLAGNVALSTVDDAL